MLGKRSPFTNDTDANRPLHTTAEKGGIVLLTIARSLGLLIASIGLASLGLGAVSLTVALRLDGFGTCFGHRTEICARSVQFNNK